MEKYIYDESNGLWYRASGGLLHPLLVPAGGPPAHRPRHLLYIKEHCEGFFTGLLLSGKLNSYLADFDRQAQEQLDTINHQMAQS